MAFYDAVCASRLPFHPFNPPNDRSNNNIKTLLLRVNVSTSLGSVQTTTEIIFHFSIFTAAVTDIGFIIAFWAAVSVMGVLLK